MIVIASMAKTTPSYRQRNNILIKKMHSVLHSVEYIIIIYIYIYIHMYNIIFNNILHAIRVITEQ